MTSEVWSRSPSKRWGTERDQRHGGPGHQLLIIHLTLKVSWAWRLQVKNSSSRGWELDDGKQHGCGQSPSETDCKFWTRFKFTSESSCEPSFERVKRRGREEIEAEIRRREESWNWKSKNFKITSERTVSWGVKIVSVGKFEVRQATKELLLWGWEWRNLSLNAWRAEYTVLALVVLWTLTLNSSQRTVLPIPRLANKVMAIERVSCSNSWYSGRSVSCS